MEAVAEAIYTASSFAFGVVAAWFVYVSDKPTDWKIALSLFLAGAGLAIRADQTRRDRKAAP